MQDNPASRQSAEVSVVSGVYGVQLSALDDRCAQPLPQLTKLTEVE